MSVLETSYVYPGPIYVVEIAVALALAALTVIYPLIGAIRRQQWGWTIAILLTASLAGVMWLVAGRRRAVIVG